MLLVRLVYCWKLQVLLWRNLIMYSIQYVHKLTPVLGMWRWHKFDRWPIILRASVLESLLSDLSPNHHSISHHHTPPPFLIENHYTTLICIKVSTYLLLFSLYFCKYLNLIFNIFIFMVVAVFKSWNGWWFSRNDIVGLYIINISLTWKKIIVIHLKFGARFKSVLQHYIW